MSYVTSNIKSSMGTFRQPREERSMKKSAALQLVGAEPEEEVEEKTAEDLEPERGEILVDIVCNNQDARSMFKKVSAKDDHLRSHEGRPFLHCK